MLMILISHKNFTQQQKVLILIENLHTQIFKFKELLQMSDMGFFF